MLTITDITNWGELDIAHLEKWITRYAKMVGGNQERRATNCIKAAITIEHEFPVTDINIWYRAVITLIFYHLTNHLKHTHRGSAKLMHNIKVLEQNFSPDINCLDSSFNNCFNNINFETEQSLIIEQCVELIGDLTNK